MRKISKKVLKISSIIGLLTTLSLGSIIPVCILHNSDNKSQLNSSNISPLSPWGPQYIPASVLDSKATGGTFDLFIDNTITRAYDFNCTDLSFDKVSEDGTIQWDGKTYSISEISSQTADANGGFAGNLGLKGNLSFPKWLKKIGAHAFFNCTGLNDASKLITIPSSIDAIGSCAFKGTLFGKMQFLQADPDAITFESASCSAHDSDWRPGLGSPSAEGYVVYVPYGSKEAYANKQNFRFTTAQIHDGTLLTKLDLDKTNIVEKVSNTATITPILDEGINPEEVTVTWTSTDTSGEYVSFSPTTKGNNPNTIKFLKATTSPIILTAKVTDYLGNTLTKTCTLSSSWKDLTSVTIDNRTPTGKAGSTIDLIAKLNDGADYLTNQITWECSDPTVASFSPNPTTSGSKVTVNLLKHAASTDNVTITAKVNDTILDTVPLVVDYADVVSLDDPTGGSTSLEGKIAVDGSDTNVWSAVVSPSTADQTVKWELQAATPGENIPNWLSIDEQGKVSWTNPDKAKKYEFYVKATTVGKTSSGTTISKTSPKITLTIKYSDITDISISPTTPLTKTVKAGTNGQIQFNGTVIPSTANPELTWTLKMTDPAVGKPNWLDIDKNTGLLTWTNLCTYGTYSFVVTATGKDSDGSDFVKDTNPIILTVDYSDVQTVSVTPPADFSPATWLTGEAFTSSAFTATVTPSTANDKVLWSIVFDSPNTMPGLTIDSNGVLKWDGNDNVGRYTFKVRAQALGFDEHGNHPYADSPAYTVEIKYQYPSFIRIVSAPTVVRATGIAGKSGYFSSPFAANILDANQQLFPSQDKTWSITSFRDDPQTTTSVPSWLHISQKGDQFEGKTLDEGLVYWDTNAVIGHYFFKVTATANSLDKTGQTIKVETTQEYEIVIENKQVESIKIDSGSFDENTKLGVGGLQSSNSFNATVTYKDGLGSSSQNVIWEIDWTSFTKDNVKADKVDWLSVKTDAGVGLINWTSSSTIGSYKFKLIAVSSEDSSVYAKTANYCTLDVEYQNVASVSIIDTEVISDNKSIIGNNGQLSAPFKANVVTDGIGLANQDVTWKIVDFKNKKTPSVEPVPSWLSIDSNGLVKWTEYAPLGDYEFSVVATSVGLDTAGKPVVSNKSKTIDLSISYAGIKTINVSSETITKDVLVNTSGSMKFTAEAIGIDDKKTSQDFRWEIRMKDGSEAPSWIKIDNLTGEVVWTNEVTKESLYQFEIRAYSNLYGYENTFGYRDLNLNFIKTVNYSFDLTRFLEISLGMGIPFLVFGVTAAIYMARTQQKNQIIIDVLEMNNSSQHKNKSKDDKKK